MSGLLELIARRRRASASRRLGPGAQNGSFAFDANGAAPAVAGEPASPPEPEVATAPQPEPAPIAPPAIEMAPPSTFIERGRIRRRARYLRQLRELQLRDIGGLLLEARRRGRERPDLVEAKVAAALDTDREQRALEVALEEHRSAAELRAAGIGGACEHCGAVFGTADSFCASCGKPV
jgi:hypothetical protein